MPKLRKRVFLLYGFPRTRVFAKSRIAHHWATSAVQNRAVAPVLGPLPPGPPWAGPPRPGLVGPRRPACSYGSAGPLAGRLGGASWGALGPWRALGAGSAQTFSPWDISVLGHWPSCPWQSCARQSSHAFLYLAALPNVTAHPEGPNKNASLASPGCGASRAPPFTPKHF